MKRTDQILLDSKNYKALLPLDIVAFSWAYGGAMGGAGGVDIVTTSGTQYYFNWAHGDLTEAQIEEILPVISQCQLPIAGDTDKVPDGWRHIYLGGGNNLIIKKQYAESLLKAWKDFSQTEEGKYRILYNSWIQLLLKELQSNA